MPLSVNWQRAILVVGIALCCADAQGQQPATSAPGSSSSRPKSKPAVKSGAPDAGSLTDGVYRNRFFGFAYKLPYGWVVRTDRMQDDSEPGKSQVLLAAFEHPPEASAETINSAVVIATESVDSYPGLKSAAEYLGPLTELTTSKGFKATKEPYEMTLGMKTLVRADFKRDMGSLTMYQSSLVILTRGNIASFTFIDDSEEQIEKLVANLSFGAQPNSSAARP